METVKNKIAREQSRLNVRLTPEIKEKIARAATIYGQDLTEFAVSTLIQKAEEILANHDVLLLESADYRFFLDALDETDSGEPSEKSRKTAKKYQRGIRKGVKHHLAD